jgi:hypothetical protein
MPAFDWKEIAAGIAVIISAAIAALRKKPDTPVATAAAGATPTAPIEPVKPGEDLAARTNTLIDILNDERAKRQEDRTKFHGLYSTIAEELNAERKDRESFKVQIETERDEFKRQLEAEQTARKLLANDLDNEAKARRDLDARLTSTQRELTIALTDNAKWIRENQQLTADNAELREVNARLLRINAELRVTNTQLLQRLELENPPPAVEPERYDIEEGQVTSG